ncbi:MAG: MBL fold metallo-hydrolase [Planctomycetaceae bacterium]
MIDPPDVPVHRIRVPNPFVEGRTCVYVIAADPVTLIDSGIATDRAWDELVAGLREHGLTPRDIRRVILTHKHIDHIGNAWRVHQESGGEVMIHETETAWISDVDPTGERFAAIARGRLAEWSVPEEIAAGSVVGFGTEWKLESVPVTALQDGQLLPMEHGDVEVIHTPGHTLGSICLRTRRSLFTGDHLLPDISSNIGGGDLRQPGLLRHFMASMARIRDLPEAESLHVLPGHGEPMPTFTARCDELIRHHERRLEQIVWILSRAEKALTVYEIARKLFGRMDGFHLVLGCAEANSHLELLHEDRRVVQTDGRYRLS